jgi:hypothetical protein
LNTLPRDISISQPSNPPDTATALMMANINVIKAVMPSPATLGTAPYFKGENITSFLDLWDDFTGDYECKGAEKRKKILRYIDPFYRDEVKAMPEYATENDEQTFYNALKKKYRDTDHERLKYSRQFLLALVA